MENERVGLAKWLAPYSHFTKWQTALNIRVVAGKKLWGRGCTGFVEKLALG